jgi:pimeloyl-ACP methyl ester carboxylesterase
MIRIGTPAVLALVAVLSASCTSPRPGPAPSGAPANPAASESASAVKACPNNPGYGCGELTVPVNRADPSGGEIVLHYIAANNSKAPKGVLLLLTGGPGQPGIALMTKVSARIAYLLDDYRLVMIDQRGTGNSALKCPKLQQEVGSSDITPATQQAVKECADAIGPDLAHYTSADTVDDLEALRAALGVDAWSLDGISYGTYVAQRYAFKYPQHVTKMVLDSVVPVNGVPALYADSLHRTAQVLRDACAATHCAGDPAADVASIVAARHNGVDLFDFLVTASIVEASFEGRSFYPVFDLLHQAAAGQVQPLNDAIADLRRGSDPGAQLYSSGLHMATICPELAAPPWAGSPGSRPAALAKATVAASDVWPFDRATAVKQGVVGNCQYWPAAAPPAPVSGKLDMPVLLLNGDRDLSTPLPWATGSQKFYTHATLAVISGMGHSVQGRAPKGDDALKAFLLG